MSLEDAPTTGERLPCGQVRADPVMVCGMTVLKEEVDAMLPPKRAQAALHRRENVCMALVGASTLCPNVAYVNGNCAVDVRLFPAQTRTEP